MKIYHLADYPHFLRQIAEWNLNEWPSYYEGKLEKAIEFHSSTITRDIIPTCLIAVEGTVLVGTVSLVTEDMDIRPTLSPWLASLYVESSFRGCGIAKRLIEACMDDARELNVSTLYVWTKELRALFESLKWVHLENVTFLGSKVDILKYNFREK